MHNSWFHAEFSKPPDKTEFPENGFMHNTDLSNREIFPTSGIFNTLDRDFYLVYIIVLLSIFSYFWSEIGGINFVERDESVANHSSILSCAGMSQREKKSFSITLISLQSATAF